MKPTRVLPNAERAETSVWWPGLSRQLEEVVKRCPTCQRFLLNSLTGPGRKLLLTYLFFELEDQQYLLVIDYFSRYVEVTKLSWTTSPDII